MKKEKELVTQGGVDDLLLVVGVVQQEAEPTKFKFKLTVLDDLCVAEHILQDAQVPYEITKRQKSVDILLKPIPRVLDPEIEFCDEFGIFYDEITGGGEPEPPEPVAPKREYKCVKRITKTPEEKKAEAKLRQRRYYVANREKYLAYMKIYHAKHRAKDISSDKIDS